MPDFYELRMLRLFEQYELSDNARTMFKALEEFKTARLDEAALGRLIRLSPNNRAALLNTMVKCAAIMKDKPKESKYCLDIITSCGSMLEIADQPPQDIGFPGFLKLPREIRERIYDIYLNNSHRTAAIIPYLKRDNCACAPHEPPPYLKFQKVQMSLAFTSKQVSNEVLVMFYRRQRFHFPCACEMNYHLTNNFLLRTTMMHVMFHWCGERADVGIRQLQTMRQLEELIVIISKITTRLLTEREHEIRQFFGTKRGSQGHLTDSLGWEELVSIRGLKKVKVEHVEKRKADRRTDGEKSSLKNMLASYLLRPADDEK